MCFPEVIISCPNILTSKQKEYNGVTFEISFWVMLGNNVYYKVGEYNISKKINIHVSYAKKDI